MTYYSFNGFVNNNFLLNKENINDNDSIVKLLNKNHIALYFFQILKVNDNYELKIIFDMHNLFELNCFEKLFLKLTFENQYNIILKYYCEQLLYYILNEKNFKSEDKLTDALFLIIAALKKIYNWNNDVRKEKFCQCYGKFMEKFIRKGFCSRIVDKNFNQHFISKRYGEFIKASDEDFDKYSCDILMKRFLLSFKESCGSKEESDIFIIDHWLRYEVVINNKNYFVSMLQSSQPEIVFKSIEAGQKEVCSLKFSSIVTLEYKDNSVNIFHLSNNINSISKEKNINIKFNDAEKCTEFLIIVNKFHNVFIDFWSEISLPDSSNLTLEMYNKAYFTLRKIYKDWNCKYLYQSNDDVERLFKSENDGQYAFYHDVDEISRFYLFVAKNEKQKPKVLKWIFDFDVASNPMTRKVKREQQDFKTITWSKISDFSDHENMSMYSVVLENTVLRLLADVLAEKKQNQAQSKPIHISSNHIILFGKEYSGKFSYVTQGKLINDKDQEELCVAVKRLTNSEIDMQNVLYTVGLYCNNVSHRHICDMFGFTVIPFIQIVSAWANFGSVHTLLLSSQRGEDVRLHHLVDIWQQSAQALHYLKVELGIGAHGNVHLNNILVFDFSKDRIHVKLCNPGCKQATFQCQNEHYETLFRRRNRLVGSRDMLDLACSVYLIFFYNDVLRLEQTLVKPKNCPQNLFDLIRLCRIGDFSSEKPCRVLTIIPMQLLKKLLPLTLKLSKSELDTAICTCGEALREPQIETDPLDVLSTEAHIAAPNSSLIDTLDELRLDSRKMPGLVECQSKKLGHGAFGTAYQSMMLQKGKWHDVAVKIVSMNCEKDLDNYHKYFEMEVKLHAEVARDNHPNILSLLGVNFDHYWLVTPFMAHGDLCRHLQDVRKKEKNGKKIIHMSQCYKYVQGIINGMIHLEKYDIYHCDLACRNLLLDEGDNVRISDFGCARKANACNNLHFPKWWTAPEVFAQRNGPKDKNDVWSFGVVIWEIISLVGYQPGDAYVGLLTRDKKPCNDDKDINKWLMENASNRLEFYNQPLIINDVLKFVNLVVCERWRLRDDTEQLINLAKECWKPYNDRPPKFSQLTFRSHFKKRVSSTNTGQVDAITVGLEACGLSVSH